MADGLSTPTLPWSLVMAELLGAVALHSMLANIQTAPPLPILWVLCAENLRVHPAEKPSS